MSIVSPNPLDQGSASSALPSAVLEAQQRSSTGKKLLFAAVMVTGTLIAMETVSRGIVATRQSERYEYRAQLAVTLGFPEMNRIFTPDEELFWKIVPNLDHLRLSGQLADAPPMSFAISTDEYGFRCMPPVSGTTRCVLFLGDSCTFGLGVDDEQTFPAVAQRMLPNTRCINMGVPGYTAFQGRLLLDRTSIQPSPDIVIITFGRNDGLVWDDRSDMEHAELVAQQRSHWTNHFRTITLLRQTLPASQHEAKANAAAPNTRLRPRLTTAEFTGEIEAILAWAKHHNAVPILVIWPMKTQLQQEGYYPHQVQLRKISQRKNVPLVNVVRLFRKAKRDDLFVDACHASVAGCELAAEAIAEVIETEIQSQE